MASVISVQGVSKSYRLGAIGGATLKEDASRLWAKMRGHADPFAQVGDRVMQRRMGDIFWALDDVSFEVEGGEALGIIGHNGAGKSTLLKILSQVTAPTSGEIRISGRIASLLEVGTGFHPELTGRENIFLNGAILGMTRSEIRQKFDEIVAFSGVEEFVDTPVKRYSSGMYVRLAFAVAAHLEPEILVIDEVLAVGDAEFQRKCLGKMQDVSKSGRTVLFVSHNMAAMGKLCARSILLRAGRVQKIGATEQVIQEYLRVDSVKEGTRTWEEPLSDEVHLHQLRLRDEDANTLTRVDIRHPFQVEMTYSIVATAPRFRLALRFLTADGTVAFTTSDSAEANFEDKSSAPGSYRSLCHIPGNLLNEGLYTLTVSADIPFQKTLFLVEGALAFTVEQTGGVNARFVEKWPGAVCPRLQWTTGVAGDSRGASVAQASLK